MLNNKKRNVYLILTIIMMIVIFLFSSQPSKNSNYLSYSITNYIFKIIEGKDEKVETTDKNEKNIDNHNTNYKNNKAEENKSNKDIFPTSNKTFYNINTIIRKSAHIFLYMMLGIFMFLFVKTYDISTKQAVFITILICFIYACLDEFNQYLRGTRTPSFKDSLIDTFGSAIGCIFNYICIAIAKRRRKY